MIYASPISFPAIPIKRCFSTFTHNRILLESHGVKFEFSQNPLKESLFGKVYRGKIVENTRAETFPYHANTMIAIKTVSKLKLATCMKQGENPIEEFQALQYIQSIGGHPNIVQSIDFLEDDEFYYSIMEFIDGSDLFDFVTKSTVPVPQDDIKAYFKQITNAIKFINKHHIVHRDLSLENIMITKDFQIKIIDFGMALLAPEHAHCDDVHFHPQGSVGKRSFTRPEVFENKIFNPMQVDIWSLGAVLYAMLTGSAPVDSPVMTDPCFKYIASGRLHVLVRHWNLPLPEEVVQLVQHMLQVKASNRIKIDDLIAHQWLEAN